MTAMMEAVLTARDEGGPIASWPTIDSDVADWSMLVEHPDQDAFRAIFDRHRKAVYNHCFRILGNWSAAEDTTQQVFMALWRRAQEGTIDPLQAETARPILISMARQECLTQQRSTGRQANLRTKVIAFHDRGEGHNVDEWVAAEDTMVAIREALAVLPAEQREVIELVCWSELSMADAAKALGVAEGTVKSRLFRARTTLAGTRAATLLGAHR
ncbi:RNA polymerase sigma factor [Aestuariimicrobium ganziense]|uniref:RNA polymerase sigma factor n=1 Tax=Aestuariimicrobium ganziense TaxID=2773677 RepID=UPI001940E91D|nr:sigma-70 family RNA polymerase sigma factor [Aestuariimicrobium ganziense]